MPFHAHEVLEDAWKAAPEAERELWRGLAQLAVGLTHAARGNTRGGVALLERGKEARLFGVLVAMVRRLTRIVQLTRPWPTALCASILRIAASFPTSTRVFLSSAM